MIGGLCMRDSAVVEAEIRHLERQIERLDRRELDSELFVDVGETEPFVLEASKGECAE